MKQFLSKLKINLPKAVWAYLGLTILSFFIVCRFVDLTPKVDNNFFFSSSDPQFRSEERISKLFLRNDSQLIVSANGDIHSQAYTENIRHLTDTFTEIPGVFSVKSITNGPKDLQDAMNSPLWKRILIADDLDSTNLVVFLDEAKSKTIVIQIESIIEKNHSNSFKLRISGLPYVVELISRYLLRDLRIFSLLAFFIFGIIIFFVFRSKSVLAGTMIACLNACIWTFMISDLLQVPIGLLTANLSTIIIVLTLSHMVFLTFHWKSACTSNDKNPVESAVQLTFPASFWSMLTTLFGFLSLLLVPAKPLRELGLSGAVGTIIAIVVAYGVYPTFLQLAKTNIPLKKATDCKQIFNFLESHKRDIRIIIFFFCLTALPGIFMINTDPSMLSFFSKKSKIYQGLEYIDKNGGSSPFVLVVKSKDGALLNSRAVFKRLWKLQEALEKHRSVGSVVSLPVLMAEAKQTPLAFFLTSDLLLDILEKPQYDEVALSFVTQDRTYGLFLLRMNELNRMQKRLTIIEEIKDIAHTQGFSPEITGGVYNLQGHISNLVSKSLSSGLIKLLLLFVIIAWIVSRSVRITFAMIVSLMLLPLGILGAIGLYRIPLDVVSSPASNVAIAIGIDSMIHMVNAYRRKKKAGEVSTSKLWSSVRDELWQPILTSAVVVVTGFSIFLFSTFPPSQRFGGAIVFGTILASLTALYIMPLLAKE